MKSTRKGFKLTSPLKQTGPGDNKKSSEASSSTKSYPAQSGGYKVTATETKVKKSATGATVSEGGNLAALRSKGKNLGPNYKPSKAETAKANKLEAEAKAKDKAAASSSKDTSGSEDTTIKTTPELTEKQTGTTSDTFTSEERRVQNRGEKVVNRQERQLGKQGLRRDKRAMKSSADWDKMTSAEKKAAKYELKKGQTSEDKASGKKGILETKFGKEFKENVEQERKMAKGQGEQNKSLTRQEIEKPGEATTTRKDQYNKGANPIFTSRTKNYEDTQKEVEGGKKIKAEPGSILPEVTPGTKSTSSSESTSNNTDGAEKKKYDFSAEGNKIPVSIGKMRSSALKFVMKGFGSKLGKK